MRTSRRLMGALAAVAAALVVGAAEAPPEPQDWQILPTDFTAYRMEVGWAEGFRTRCELERPLHTLMNLIGEARWTEAVETGRTWLDRCPVDIRFHHATSFVLAKLDRPEESDLHSQWAKGLMDSVGSSGDGQTPDTAYITISIAEG